jgi:hypothetical protein
MRKLLLASVASLALTAISHQAHAQAAISTTASNVGLTTASVGGTQDFSTSVNSSAINNSTAVDGRLNTSTFTGGQTDTSVQGTVNSATANVTAGATESGAATGISTRTAPNAEPESVSTSSVTGTSGLSATGIEDVTGGFDVTSNSAATNVSDANVNSGVGAETSDSIGDATVDAGPSGSDIQTTGLNTTGSASESGAGLADEEGISINPTSGTITAATP